MSTLTKDNLMDLMVSSNRHFRLVIQDNCGQLDLLAIAYVDPSEPKKNVQWHKAINLSDLAGTEDMGAVIIDLLKEVCATARVKCDRAKQVWG